MKCWLDIIGVGEGGIKTLGVREAALLAKAENVLGPARFIERLCGANPKQTLVVWRPPFSSMIEQVMAARASSTVILASGEPNWFGIGSSLSAHLEADEFVLHPAPSAFQLAAARLRWPLQNTTTISLHGRAVELLHPHILPCNRILALTSGAKTLDLVAKILVARGYGPTRLSVLENLGGTSERLLTFCANEAAAQNTGEFFTLAIDCVAGADAPLLPAIPGLADEAFANDGQLSKREVRAVTLARLAPFVGALLWDVGAGCGSVAIEWMRSARGAKAICFEKSQKRCDLIAQNRLALGVPGLKIVSGSAPAGFADYPPPDAVFIGGEISNQALFAACYQALKPGGRLVANAVTLDGTATLFAHYNRLGGELVQIGVSHLENIGSSFGFKPRRPVTQFCHVKERRR